MIDKYTLKKLEKVGQKVWKQKQKDTVVERPMADEKQKLLDTLKRLKQRRGGDGGDLATNEQAIKQIEKMLASGAYDKTVEKFDEEKLDKMWEKKVNLMLKKGIIKPIDLKNDAFLKKLRKKRYEQRKKAQATSR